MSDSLIKQIRRSRETKVTIGKFVFTVRRPTDVEFIEHRELRVFEIAQGFVVGWENVTEADIVKGGGEDSVDFSVELWREWCADRPDFWEPIFSEVLSCYERHSDNRREAVKN